MPLSKYIADRFRTTFQIIFTGAKLSEYHTGFCASWKIVLTNLPLLENFDNQVFDDRMLA